jgi:hypothetical protein
MQVEPTSMAAILFYKEETMIKDLFLLPDERRTIRSTLSPKNPSKLLSILTLKTLP